MIQDPRTEYDWKELKIDNLPPDIFQDNVYEFGYYNESQKNNGICQESSSLKTWFNRWWGGDCSHLKYYYRKHQPKQPTYEEMAKKYAEKEHPYLSNNYLGLGGNTIIDGFREIAEKAFLEGVKSVGKE